MAISSFNSIAGYSVGESNTLVIDDNSNVSGNVGTFTSVNVASNITATNITANGTVTANYIFSTGNITGSGIVTAGESSVGNVRASGLVNAANVTANNTVTTNTLVANTISGNLVPKTDNTYFLGNSTNRWANLWLGPGTIYITDTANTSNTAELTVANGILQINGAAGLQANLVSGNSSLTIANSGNISLSVAGTSNVAVFSNSGANISGNVFVGNLRTTSISGNASTNSNITFTSSGINIGANGSPNIVQISTAGSGAATFTLTDPDGAIFNLTNSGSGVTLIANPAQGINVTGGGSLPLTAGNSNIRVYPNGAITMSSTGVANVVTVSSTGANINGNVSVGNLTVTGNIISNPVYGSFWSNATQTTANANIVQLFTLNNTDGHNNIVLGNGASNSRMIINDPGTYNLQFSVQLNKTSSSLDSVYIWLRQNGQDIANTAGYFQVDRDTAMVQSWNFIINTSNVGDYVEVAFATTDTTISFPAIAAQTTPYVRPEIPSIITTIVPVGA